MNVMQQHNCLGPRLLGPWGGAKRSDVIKSQLQSQFQTFLNSTLCVFSQVKYIKHKFCLICFISFTCEKTHKVEFKNV